MSAFAFGSPGLALAAGAAVAVPVAIHLLLRRRRLPVEWAAMELLREAIRRVERRRRLERLLLLAVRCMVVAAAGLAIAAPFLGDASAGSRATRSLVVVVDDSCASNERVDGGTAFERSIAAARSAIESLGAGDRVAVVATSRAGSTSREAASLDHRGALQRLASMSASELPGDLVAAIDAAKAILANRESEGSVREILVASGFRTGSVGAMAPLAKAGAAPGSGSEREIAIIAVDPPEAAGANLRVSTLETERIAAAGPGAPASVVVTVARDRGDGPVDATVRVSGPTLTAPIERPLRLAQGERERAITVSIPERAAAPGTFARRAVVASVSADAQPIDDARALVLVPNERIRAVVVDRRSFDASAAIDRLPAGEWIARALAPGDPPSIDVVQVDPAALDARAVAAADAIFLLQPQQATPAQWQALTAFVERGGMLVVTPSAGERPQPWTTGFASAFGMPWRFDLEATEADASVALSAEQPGATMLTAIGGEISQLAPSVEVFRSLRVDASGDPAAVQLACRDGSPFMLTWRPKDARGSVVVLTSAVDIAWTTLPLKPFMVPLWQELVTEGRRRASAAQTVVVGSQPQVDRAGIVELRPVAPDGGALPGARTLAVGAGGRISQPIERSGLLEMVDGSGVVRGMMGVTADAASASVVAVERDRIAGWLGAAGSFRWASEGEGATDRPVAGGASRAVSAVSFAPWLFALALGLALVEALLARRFSHAVRHASAGRHDVPRVAAGGAS